MPLLRTIEADSDLRELVRELAQSPEHDGSAATPLLSLYVNLDPREFALAPARASGFTSALDDARRRAPDASWGPMLDALRDEFAATDYDIDGAQGLLVYGCPDGEATLVKLPRPVEAHVAFDAHVHIRPLVEALPTDQWCILLCNRRATRILVGDRDHLEQVEAFRDEVEGQHAMGGWSQARYARNIEGQVEDHLRHAARVLAEFQRAGGPKCLLVGAPAELRGELESRLHEDSRRTLCGWIDVDIEHANVGQVLDVAAHAIAEHDRERTIALLDRLRQNAGRNTRAAVGLEEVLAAAREMRLETLVVDQGFSSPGMACPHGDWLQEGGAGECPTHGAALEPCADVVEAVIELAVRQAAHVSVVPRVDPVDQVDGVDDERDAEAFLALRSLGSIAALTRFDLTEAPPTAG